MSLPATVLYDAHDVLAVDKPAGLTVIPARDEPADDSLHKQLERALGVTLWVVHRLDRDTSGVLLFARSAAQHRALCLAFEHRRVQKHYTAFAVGPLAPSGTITIALHTARRGQMRPAKPDEPDALASETRFSVTASRECSLGTLHEVSLSPRTGRQHQLRVHLRAVGAPLLIDPIYARRDALEAGALGAGSPALTRLTLHAEKLTVKLGDETLTLQAPPPADLASLSRWMRDPGPAETVVA